MNSIITIQLPTLEFALFALCFIFLLYDLFICVSYFFAYWAIRKVLRKYTRFTRNRIDTLATIYATKYTLFWFTFPDSPKKQKKANRTTDTKEDKENV